MIEYWPDKQSTNLNNEVAYLFLTTKQKFTYNLSNITNESLYIDILDNSSRCKLFSIVLAQLEILILDIVELDLNIENIKLLNYKILYDLTQKSLVNFIKILHNNKDSIDFIEKKHSYYLESVLLEHRILFETLLLYLGFGSSNISYKLFAFNNKNTPKKHVSILLENLIVQVSNLVIFMIFENIKSLSKLTYFLTDNRICNSIYISTRSLALFRNNLICHNLLYNYISQPKAIYSARYRVWIISSNGLNTKYIYASRLEDLSRLSTIKLMFIFFMEIQDIIWPQIEKILLISGKILLYIFINILGNSVIFLVRAIVSGIYSIPK